MLAHNLSVGNEVSLCEERDGDKLCFALHIFIQRLSKVKSLDSDKSFTNGLSWEQSKHWLCKSYFRVRIFLTNMLTTHGKQIQNMNNALTNEREKSK